MTGPTLKDVERFSVEEIVIDFSEVDERQFVFASDYDALKAQLDAAVALLRRMQYAGDAMDPVWLDLDAFLKRLEAGDE